MGAKIDIDEVLAARQAIAARLIELEGAVARLRAEAAEIDTAIRVFQRVQQASEVIPTSTEPDDDGDLPRGTLRRHIETALNTYALDGQTVSSIREYIQKRYNIDIQPNTISVTLNRLKMHGSAKLEGQRWSPIRHPRTARDQWDPVPFPEIDQEEDDEEKVLPF